MINELSFEKKLPNLCTVINGVDLKKRKYGYYYGYGKYCLTKASHRAGLFYATCGLCKEIFIKFNKPKHQDLAFPTLLQPISRHHFVQKNVVILLRVRIR